MNFLFGILLNCAVFSLSPIAQASSCKSISDDGERLSCYDQQSQTQENSNSLAAQNLTQQNFTPLSKVFDLDANDPDGILTVRPHRPMYIIPAWYNSNLNKKPKTPNQAEVDLYQDAMDYTEVKLQMSFKSKLLQDVFGSKADVWFAYTQQAHWQLYNKKHSSPFRNTDYTPELFITQPVSQPLWFDGRLRMLAGGINHQSNGQADPLSRSWNRLFVTAGMEWHKLTVIPRVWWRIPDNEKDDDNPDIHQYMGYGDLRLLYGFGQKNTVSWLLRYNPKSNKGAIQLGLTRPIVGRLNGYIQMHYGYGDNLLDYNHFHRSIGFGIVLNDWLAL